MEPIDRAVILLAEYATLRAEIIARTGHKYQLFAIGSALGAAVIVAFVSKVPGVIDIVAGAIDIAAGAIDIAALEPLIIPVALSGCLLLIYLWSIRRLYKTIERDRQQLALRVKEIEKAVNVLAGEVLLIWETRHGGHRDPPPYGT
jgi:hypothetical protein